MPPEVNWLTLKGALGVVEGMCAFDMRDRGIEELRPRAPYRGALHAHMKALDDV